MAIGGAGPGPDPRPCDDPAAKHAASDGPRRPVGSRGPPPKKSRRQGSHADRISGIPLRLKKSRPVPPHCTCPSTQPTGRVLDAKMVLDTRTHTHTHTHTHTRQRPDFFALASESRRFGFVLKVPFRPARRRIPAVRVVNSKCAASGTINSFEWRKNTHTHTKAPSRKIHARTLFNIAGRRLTGERELDGGRRRRSLWKRRRSLTTC